MHNQGQRSSSSNIIQKIPGSSKRCLDPGSRFQRRDFHRRSLLVGVLQHDHDEDDHDEDDHDEDDYYEEEETLTVCRKKPCSS